jgi:hypothetical protein
VNNKIELSAYLVPNVESLGQVRWGSENSVGIVLDGHITIGGRGDLGSDQYKMTAGQRGQQKYTSRPGQIDPTLSMDTSVHHEVLVDNWKIKEIVLPADIPPEVDRLIQQYKIPVRRLGNSQAVAEGSLNEASSDEAWELVGQPVPEIQQFVKQMGYGDDDQSVAKITAVIDRVISTQLPVASIPKLKNLANKGTDVQTLKAVQQISGKPDAEQQYTKLMKARDAAEGRDRDVSGYLQYVKSGNYDPPVLLKLPTGIYVIGGRTRLYAALALGVPANVKIISANDFQQGVAEAETATQNSRQLAKEFRQLGYSQIGSGADATVWAKDSSYVIKILMPEDAGSRAEQIFRKFYEFSMAHQDLACVPKFNEVNTIDINGKDYTQIEMERLAPIEKGTFMEGIVWLLSDYVAEQTPWPTIESELAMPDTWEMYSPNYANALARTWQNLLENPAGRKTYAMYRQLYNVMKLLFTTGTINKFGWDLHTANVMRRNNGQPVIIDPWFSSGTS